MGAVLLNLLRTWLEEKGRESLNSQSACLPKPGQWPPALGTHGSLTSTPRQECPPLALWLSDFRLQYQLSWVSSLQMIHCGTSQLPDMVSQWLRINLFIHIFFWFRFYEEPVQYTHIWNLNVQNWAADPYCTQTTSSCIQFHLISWWFSPSNCPSKPRCHHWFPSYFYILHTISQKILVTLCFNLYLTYVFNRMKTYSFGLTTLMRVKKKCKCIIRIFLYHPWESNSDKIWFQKIPQAGNPVLGKVCVVLVYLATFHILF